jgi:hypothetical protein
MIKRPVNKTNLIAVRRVYTTPFRGRVEYHGREDLIGKNKARYYSTTVDVGDNAATRALPFNTFRKYLLIQNKTAASVYLDFDQQATTDSIEIFTLGAYESISGIELVSEIWIRGSTTAQRINVVEGF